jgi:DNA-directed RNA polymerase specialized sigma24 family protein
MSMTIKINATDEIDQSLASMSLECLAERSLQEMQKYRRHEGSNDIYCLEIIRRAVMLRDNTAWIVLQHHFNENIRQWLNGHAYREVALRYETEQTYIDDAFRRFWQAVSDQSLVFSTVAAALSYLRLCLHCAIMDTLRAFSRANIERLPDTGHPDEPQVEDSYHEEELWETIRSILSGERELRVAYLHFHCNLKPREIIRFCPGEFKNEEEIYRLKRNIMERILRNADKIRWRMGSNVAV